MYACNDLVDVLEVHDIADVQVRSREDAAAVRLLNLRTSAIQLSTQGIAREVPVFGTVEGMRISGIIDELTLDQVKFLTR